MSDGDELLEQLAPLDLRSRLESPAACVTHGGQPLDDPTELFDHIGLWLFTPIPGMAPELTSHITTDPDRRRVVAISVAFQSVTGRVATTCFLANAVARRRLVVTLDDLRWWPDHATSALGLAEVRTAHPVGWDTLIRQLVDEVFAPWVHVARVAAARAAVPVGERLLWGNAATSLLVATESLRNHVSGPDLAALAPAIARALPVGDLFTTDGHRFRRTTCCLIDQAGVPRCDECSR